MIQFNHNGAADGPGWDDVAYGALSEAREFVNRGDTKAALQRIEEAKAAIEQYLEGN